MLTNEEVYLIMNVKKVLWKKPKKAGQNGLDILV